MKTAFFAAMASLVLAPAVQAAPPAAYAVSGVIPGADGGWDYASVDRPSHRLFVAHGNAIMAVDLRTQIVQPAFSVAHHAHAVLPMPGTGQILETEGDTATVRLLDVMTGAQKASLAVGDKPDAATWDARRRRAIVMNGRSGTVSVIDPHSRTVKATIALRSGLESAAIDHAGLLYVNNEDDNDVTVVDLDRAAIVSRIALPGCEGPTGMAFAPRANRIVSSCGNGVAIVIDPARRKAVGELTIGRGADAVFVDPVRHMLFVPGGDDGTLSLFSDRAAGLVPAGMVKTEKGARTGAVDPDTGRVYLPMATAATGAGAGKRSYVPGSFHVVIVSPAR